MTTVEKSKYEEQRERTIAGLRRMVAEKREYEKKAIEDCKNDPESQAFVARLDKKNAERGTPIT